MPKKRKVAETGSSDSKDELIVYEDGTVVSKKKKGSSDTKLVKEKKENPFARWMKDFPEKAARYCAASNFAEYLPIYLESRTDLGNDMSQLSIDYLTKLYDDQNASCAYFFMPFEFQTSFIREDGGVVQYYLRPSLDRIDSDGSYTPGNVQWVIANVNYAKSDQEADCFRRTLLESVSQQAERDLSGISAQMQKRLNGLAKVDQRPLVYQLYLEQRGRCAITGRYLQHDSEGETHGERARLMIIDKKRPAFPANSLLCCAWISSFRHGYPIPLIRALYERYRTIMSERQAVKE